MRDLILTEIPTLHEALDNEYKVWVTYGQVMADFGEVQPFAAIRGPKRWGGSGYRQVGQAPQYPAPSRLGAVVMNHHWRASGLNRT